MMMNKEENEVTEDVSEKEEAALIQEVMSRTIRNSRQNSLSMGVKPFK
jgi:hypothetical protein